MGFRTKLTLVSILGVCLLIGGTTWPILGLVWSNFDRLATAHFVGLRQGLTSMQNERVSHLRDIGEMMVEIPELRALIAEQRFEISADNVASLKDRLDYVTNVMNVEFVCALDSQGQVITQNSASPFATLNDLRNYMKQSEQAKRLTQQLFVPGTTQKGNQGQFGLWLYNRRLYQVVGLPLVFADDNNQTHCDGAMIMAVPVTTEMARDLAGSHDCELSFFTNDGGIISSLPAEQARQLSDAPKTPAWQPNGTFDLVLDGTTYRTHVEPLVDPCSGATLGTVVSQLSMAQGIALQKRITRRIWAIVASALLLAAMVSVFFSGAITSPVRELLRNVRRVGEGDLSAVNVSKRRDEFGELSTAFSNMVQQLQARRELELRVTESQAASKAKSQFLANMSHEIRTPLHGVIGMANLLLNTDMSERQRHYAQLVKNSTEVLTALINDILDFSKIEAGKLELENVEFNLHTVIEDVSELLYQKSIQKGVEIIADIAPDVPRLVSGDPTRLRQILLNLVGNAIKFTEAGQVVVSVQRQTAVGREVCLRFEVRDTGIGIPPEGLQRLFRSFSQVDASTTRRYGGTGLGLAICKQLCELMGGQIGVESEVGKGSNFHFTIKMQDNDPPAPALRPLAGMRILVADRNPVVRQVIVRQLIGLGAEAVDATHEPGHLIADQRQAGKTITSMLLSRDVKDFTAILNECTEAGITRILLAGDADPSGDHASREAGFAGVVNKPVRVSQLLRVLSEGVQRPDRTTTATVARHVPRVVNSNPDVRVLVAEDNEINRIVVAEFLRKAGLQSDVVKDGKYAVEALAARKYDIVLMDCQMPVMDGFEATQRIREHEAARRTAGEAVRAIPIIALTANASGADRDRCLAAGMNAYCGKPFRESELLQTISHFLAENVPLDPPAATPIETKQATVSQVAQPAAADDSSTQPLRAEAVLDRCSGNAQLALTILAKFEGQVGELVNQVQGHLARQDATQLAREAHSIKGTAGLLGAERLRGVLAELERCGRQNALDEAQRHLETLQSEISECVNCIPRIRAQLQEQIQGPI